MTLLSECKDIEYGVAFGDETDAINSTSGIVCRAECMQNASCNFWSWSSKDSKCYLYETKTISQQHKEGFYSGEKICKSKFCFKIPSFYPQFLSLLYDNRYW